MSELHRITIDPAVCGGRPYLRGLRIRVADVLDLLAAGASREEILRDYPLLEAGDIAATLEHARCSRFPGLRAEVSQPAESRDNPTLPLPLRCALRVAGQSHLRTARGRLTPAPDAGKGDGTASCGDEASHETAPP